MKVLTQTWFLSFSHQGELLAVSCLVCAIIWLYDLETEVATVGFRSSGLYPGAVCVGDGVGKLYVLAASESRQMHILELDP